MMGMHGKLFEDRLNMVYKCVVHFNRSTPDEGPRVNLKNVMEMLASIHNKWRLVGIAVGLDAPTLDKIRANFPIDTKEALVEVVSKWLCGIDPEPTWQGLAEALSSAIVEESQLAAVIKERYCSQPQSGKSFNCSSDRRAIGLDTLC